MGRLTLIPFADYEEADKDESLQEDDLEEADFEEDDEGIEDEAITGDPGLDSREPETTANIVKDHNGSIDEGFTSAADLTKDISVSKHSQIAEQSEVPAVNIIQASSVDTEPSEFENAGPPGFEAHRADNAGLAVQANFPGGQTAKDSNVVEVAEKAGWQQGTARDLQDTGGKNLEDPDGTKSGKLSNSYVVTIVDCLCYWKMFGFQSSFTGSSSLGLTRLVRVWYVLRAHLLPSLFIFDVLLTSPHDCWSSYLRDNYESSWSC